MHTDPGVDTDLLVALESLQDEWERREIPSPSTVGMCFRRQWFLGRGAERSERIAPSSILAMERGKALEPLGYALAERAGFIVSPSITLPKEVLSSMNLKRGAVDMILAKPGELGLWLGEVKVLGMWGYGLTLDKGLIETDPNYYYQAQLYMEAIRRLGYEVKGCIFMMFSADPTAWSWYFNRIKKIPKDDERRYPAMKTLEIAPDKWWVNEGIKRALLVTAYLNETEGKNVPREFDPYNHGEAFPCGWCGFLEKCRGAG